MKEQLLRFLNRENISAARFADDIGVQRSSISHILSGRNKPSYDFLVKVLDKYEFINAEWLITGKGEMYKTDVNHVSKDTGLRDLFQDVPPATYERGKEKVIGGSMPAAESDNQEQQQADTGNILKVTNVNSPERIVFFYRNGEFKEYNPSGSNI